MPIGYFITVDFRRKDTIYLERQPGQLGQLDCPLAERGGWGGDVAFWIGEQLDYFSMATRTMWNNIRYECGMSKKCQGQ